MFCIFLNISLFYMCGNESAASTKAVNTILCFCGTNFSKLAGVPSLKHN